ncbi:hypothetical protein AJ79_09205 [Helicocarpus griseus UAMH5409]|uniref:Carrier domain-containing protein n=1 Tax=Helicocarpus griseus UAMH5409 TaxID=1447875 RepID=A0A2B7WLC0_9EURO|nr:hypothetical protein AJ79_09205 [Helicocarpus griseus UAMH5409]
MGEGIIRNQSPRTVYELIEQRVIQDPDIPLIAYPAGNRPNNIFIHYTSNDLANYSDRVARYYASSIDPRRNSSDREKIVALLAPSTVDYLISALALSKLGFTVLFLSTRLSDADFVNLLNATGCSEVVLDRAFLERISGQRWQIPGLRVRVIADSAAYLNAAAPSDQADSNLVEQKLDPNIETNHACWIIHSSGSTGPPKPIWQTHSAILRNAADNFNMAAFITLPLFHSHGISSVFRGITSKKEVYLYSGSLPLTGPRLVDIFRKYDFELFSGVPYALKMIAETPGGIELLSRMKLVTFGGSSCPDALGDELVRKGVRLACHYGCTECGQLMTSVRPPDEDDWSYLRVIPKAEPFLRFEEQQSTGLYELVVLAGWPPKVAENRADGSYATKDLFMKHPTKLNCWKLVGRLDDTIVLLNGEKAIPLQMEQSVKTNPYVADAVVFGSGKPMLGMFVIASENAQNLSTKEVLGLIEIEVAQANAILPAYARIDMNMICVLPFGTTYPKTDKGTVIRATFYAQFKDSIEQVYTDAECSSSDARQMTHPKLVDFLRKTFAEILRTDYLENKNLQDDTDLFSLGLDSLQAIRARGKIVKHVVTHGHAIRQNLVFEYPSIVGLADYLVSLGTKNDVKGKETPASSEDMRKLVEKYSRFKRHVPTKKADKMQHIRRTVMITGCTGSLGAHVLSQLVKRRDVCSVYCLVRAPSTEHANARVVDSLKTRKLYGACTPRELEKLSALPSSLDEDSFGLDDRTYGRLLTEVDIVIHLAWAVNFNLGLSSFESHIAGTRNLIQFCFSAHSLEPARFFLASSIAAVMKPPAPARVPEIMPDMSLTDLSSHTELSGYGQSKLVAELICARAAKLGGVCRVLRLGQIVGDCKHGLWNPNEAYPLIVQSAVTTGALPELKEKLSWLPVDIAAAAIVDLVSLKNKEGNVTSDALFHLIQPTTIDWCCDFLPALRAAGLKFEQLPPKQWVSRLRTNPDPVANPPVKLLSFFEGKYGTDKGGGELYFCTDRACSLSPTLHSAKQLSPALVAKMVKYWQTECWDAAQNG